MFVSKVSIRSEFEAIYQRSPETVAQAPGRINLIGEHVDYNDGLVLPFAIDAVTTCAISLRKDEKISIFSKQQPNTKIEITTSALQEKKGSGWDKYVLGVLWALEINEGVDIYIDGKVPLGAGLSSSAALECSIATALNSRLAMGIDLATLARLTQKAENEYVGVPCGIMDQSISLMGKSGHALLLDCRDLSSTLIPVDFEGFGLQLLIIDTGVHHELVDGGYANRRASCESAVATLGIKSLRVLEVNELDRVQSSLDSLTFRRVKHVVSEIERVRKAVTSLNTKDFKALGSLLTESHRSLADDYQVSCDELNLAVESALSNGALGARMVGGGFGGSAIALINESKAGVIAQEIEKAFAKNSFAAPRFFTSLPSDGAKIIN